MKKLFIENKKAFIVLGVFLLLLIGVTLAYFGTTDYFENTFHTDKYASESEEVFTSPTGWKPGDTTSKTLTVKNTGDMCENVRISYTEEWTSGNDATLPNAQNGNNAAIINFANTSDWIQSGNYYYYNKNLNANQTTSSFLSSVQFNPLITNSGACTTASGGRHCESTGNGYDDADYTLTFHIETIQCEVAQSTWGVDPTSLTPVVPPTPSQGMRWITRQNQNSITVGDELAIDTEHFYVFSTDSSSTFLLAKYNLYVGDILDGSYNHVSSITSATTGYGLQSNTALGYYTGATQIVGVVPFSGTAYWDDGNGSLLPDYGSGYTTNPYPYVYDSVATGTPVINYNSNPPEESGTGYSIDYYVDNYVTELITLGAPSGTLGLVPTIEDYSSFGCTVNRTTHSGNCNTNNEPAWLSSTSYWLGDVGSHYAAIWGMDDGQLTGDVTVTSSVYSASSNRGVRPLINLLNSDIANLSTQS